MAARCVTLNGRIAEAERYPVYRLCLLAMIMKMNESLPPEPPEREELLPLDDAQFAIVVLLLTSLTLIFFVLLVTLWMS